MRFILNLFAIPINLVLLALWLLSLPTWVAGMALVYAARLTGQRLEANYSVKINFLWFTRPRYGRWGMLF